MISLIVLIYSAGTWVGMYVYGVETWLKNGDPFHVVFGLYGRFALIAGGDPGPGNPCRRGMIIKAYAARLLQYDEHTVSFSVVAFVLAMLSTVLFDGLLGSGYWVSFENFIHEIDPALGDLAWISVYSISLIGVWAIFFGMFVGTCRIMSWLANNELSTVALAQAFALSLIPIVIGYHFAHTFSYLLVQGQSIFSLISDPFGFGWDIFGSAGNQVDLTVMTTKNAWYLAVTAIVAGHVVSIYLAHVVSERLFNHRLVARKCLVPMTILMVVYTIVSLTILAEPLVKYSGPNEEIVWMARETSAMNL